MCGMKYVRGVNAHKKPRKHRGTLAGREGEQIYYTYSIACESRMTRGYNGYLHFFCEYSQHI